jgi:hypothetical protein
MKKLITGARGLMIAISIVGLILMLAGISEAGFKTVVGGITVAYSNDGANAYYDDSDGTLTVEITQGDGSLKITVGPDATLTWGEYVDIYLIADDANLESIKIKGTYSCKPYIVGQVGYVSTFSLINGVVGDTSYYGRDQGLGMVSLSIPKKITLQNSYATAQIFGYEITSQATLTNDAGRHDSHND